jgi:hypothetical protein
LYIAVDGQHRVAGNDQAPMKSTEQGGLDRGDAGFGAGGIKSIRGRTKEDAAHGARGGFQQVISLRANAGDLDLDFPG